MLYSCIVVSIGVSSKVVDKLLHTRLVEKSKSKVCILVQITTRLWCPPELTRKSGNSLNAMLVQNIRMHNVQNSFTERALADAVNSVDQYSSPTIPENVSTGS